MVGGLLTSAFLTLFIIPVVYTLFSDLGKLWRKPSVLVSVASLESGRAAGGNQQGTHPAENEG